MSLPSIVIDNFFSDPWKVREKGLLYATQTQEANSVKGGFLRGQRSENVKKLEPDLYNYLIFKICRSYLGANFLADDIDNVECHSEFQLTDATWGNGWVHSDSCLMTGILYLSPEPDIDAGTSLFQGGPGIESIHDNIKKESNKSVLLRNTDQYLKAQKENNDQFVKHLSIKNVFNRSFTFSGHTYHSADYFFGTTREKSRLTLVTFINNFGPKFKWNQQ
jgi:hypothetical protein